MAKVRVPTAEEEKILRENRMEPREYGVLNRDETSIRLLCYITRDVIEIHKGDRAW